MMKNSLDYLNVVGSRLLNRAPDRILILYLELTKVCNLKCKICDIWASQVRREEELTTDELLDLIEEARALGVKIIALTGGETLLRDDLETLVRAIKKRGMGTSLNTNGTLMTEERARSLLAAGLRNISLSIDGSTPELHDSLRGIPGAHAGVLNAIRILGRHPFHLNVITVLNRANYLDLPRIIELVRDLNIHSLKLAPMHRCYPYDMCGTQKVDLADFAEKELENLEVVLDRARNLMKEYRIETTSETNLRGLPAFFRTAKIRQKCFAGYAYCYVESDGNLLPCQGIPAKLFQVRDRRLREIWRSPEFHALRQRVRNQDCQGCWDICTVEPNLVCSPTFLARNYRSTLRAIQAFTGT